MLRFVYNFFKISSLNFDAQKFIMRATITQYLFVFLISFSNMFIFLTALPVLGVANVAILLSVLLLTQSFCAILAGVFGDSKSFRIVISISVLFYILTYRMVIIAQNFNGFLIVYILLGIATAFNQDGFFSYFDNNYDYYVYEDTKRSVYSEFVGKFVALNYLILALGYSIGAYYSSITSKNDLFNLSSYLLLIVLFFTFLFYKDHKNFKLKKKSRDESFFSMLPKAVKYTWKKRTLRFFIIGIVIAELTTVFWNELYSILLYSQIGANNDSYIGFIFSSEVLITALLVGFLGILAGRVMRIKFWYLLSLLLAYTTFYFGLSYFLQKNPIPQLFSINYLAIFLGLYSVLMTPYNFNYVLYYRTVLDLMPEKYRGSIYSIISSLKSIIGSIVLFVGGN